MLSIMIGGGSVGIGEGGNLYFFLAGASFHFKYFYAEDYIHYDSK